MGEEGKRGRQDLDLDDDDELPEIIDADVIDNEDTFFDTLHCTKNHMNEPQNNSSHDVFRRFHEKKSNNSIFKTKQCGISKNGKYFFSFRK